MLLSGKLTRSGPHRKSALPSLHIKHEQELHPMKGTISVLTCRIERRRFGLLERKKDYKARADDFHRKEKALEVLQRKAEERNPDEFYFGMEHARTRGGVHVKRSALSTGLRDCQ